ncbi:hypothetical protein C6558_08320 [Ensifer sp. NM-2]|nr:hypothetical protein C6558_08320 [Ensifer sp. NM-2]
MNCCMFGRSCLTSGTVVTGGGRCLGGTACSAVGESGAAAPPSVFGAGHAVAGGPFRSGAVYVVPQGLKGHQAQRVDQGLEDGVHGRILLSGSSFQRTCRKGSNEFTVVFG